MKKKMFLIGILLSLFTWVTPGQVGAISNVENKCFRCAGQDIYVWQNPSVTNPNCVALPNVTKNNCKASVADKITINDWESNCKKNGGTWTVDINHPHKGICSGASDFPKTSTSNGTSGSTSGSTSGTVTPNEPNTGTNGSTSGTVTPNEPNSGTNGSANGTVSPGETNNGGNTSSNDRDKVANDMSTTFCGTGSEMVDDIPSALPVFISNVIKTIQYLIPVILIILGMLDFARAVISQDEKQMKESQSRFIRRLIAAVFIFFVVVLVKFVFASLVNSSSITSCINCFINGECGNTQTYKKKNCSDYRKQSSCYRLDDYGKHCEWSESNNECRESQKKYNRCENYTEKQCSPDKDGNAKVDDYGKVCKLTVFYTDKGRETVCASAGAAKYCSEYTADECPQTDGHGWKCKISGIYEINQGPTKLCMADSIDNVVE